MVNVSSVIIKGLGSGWTVPKVKESALAGFAFALNVQPKDLTVDVEVNDAGDTWTATALATVDVALKCDAFFKVEKQVALYLERADPDNKLIEVQPNLKDASDDTEIDVTTTQQLGNSTSEDDAMRFCEQGLMGWLLAWAVAHFV